MYDPLILAVMPMVVPSSLSLVMVPASIVLNTSFMFGSMAFWMLSSVHGELVTMPLVTLTVG